MTRELDHVRRLAAGDNGLAIVSVPRPDGTVHSSLVNAGVLDDSPLGAGPVVATVIRGDARKLDYVRRTGHLTVTFRVGWQWASVDGPATLLGPDDQAAGFTADRLPGLLRDIFTAAGGTHDDWAEYDRVMAAERRVAVLVRPDRILGVSPA